MSVVKDMKVPIGNNLSLSNLKGKLIKKFHDNNSVLGESALSNNLRIHYLSIISSPIRIIVLFSFRRSYDTLALKTWSKGIIASHSLLLIFMIGFFIITHVFIKSLYGLFLFFVKSEPKEAINCLYI